MIDVMNGTAQSVNVTPVRPPSTGAVKKIERAMSNQRQFARTAGVDPSHLCLMLAGKRKPSLDVAARIAQMIGVSLDDLYSYLTLRAPAPTPAVN